MLPENPTPARPPRQYDVFQIIGSRSTHFAEIVANNAAHAAELYATTRNVHNGCKLVVHGVMDHGEPSVSLFTVDRRVSLIKGH